MKIVGRLPGFFGGGVTILLVLLFLLQPIVSVSCTGLPMEQQGDAICGAITEKLRGKMLFFSPIPAVVDESLYSQQRADTVTLQKVARMMGGNVVLTFTAVDVVALLELQDKRIGVTADGKEIVFSFATEPPSEKAFDTLLQVTFEPSWNEIEYAPAFQADLVRYIAVFANELQAQKQSGGKVKVLHPTWMEYSLPDQPTQPVFLLDLSTQPVQTAERIALIAHEVVESQHTASISQSAVPGIVEASVSAKKQVKRVDWSQVMEVDLRFRLPVTRGNRTSFGTDVFAQPTPVSEKVAPADDPATASAQASEGDTPIDSPE